MTTHTDYLLETFDKWAVRDHRERFLRRMQHKLQVKELRYGS